MNGKEQTMWFSSPETRPPHTTERYLVHLVTQDRRLPRRQEAEGENFVDFAGKTRSALVDHEEVQAWAAGWRSWIYCKSVSEIKDISHAEAYSYQISCVTDPIHVLRYGVYAVNDSGRRRIYGYAEVTQRLLLNARVRGSSSWWWLDFASWILILLCFGQRNSPSGRTVGCMT